MNLRQEQQTGRGFTWTSQIAQETWRELRKHLREKRKKRKVTIAQTRTGQDQTMKMETPRKQNPKTIENTVNVATINICGIKDKEI
jgi:uncharacterized protein YebE (UPF0316 family)